MKQLIFILFIFLLGTCTFPKYSFNGGKLNEDLETVSIAYFENNSSLGPANLAQIFTESLRDLFQSQTRLELVTDEGDLAYEGNISSYVIQPIAIQGNQTAAQNRLTITVNVDYINSKEKDKDFNQSFTRFADFDASQDLSSVETALIDEIFDQITQDIYNKTLGDW